MAGFSISVDLNADAATRQLLRVMKAAERRRLLAAIGNRVLEWVNQNFREEGAEEKWEPLSPNTIAGRRGGGSGAKILRDTGRLAQSFTSRVRGSVAIVGTSDKRASWHHLGTDPYQIRPKTATALRFMTGGGPVFTRRVSHPGLPERPLLPSTALAGRLATQVVQAAIRKSVRSA
jgi:phage virion morphogenesis protein